MRLSVVIATRDSARFLQEALDSVSSALGPWPDTSVEILIADGGSTDETLTLAGMDPRVRIVSRRDDGIYSGMNLGLAAASGDAIVILNSDDLLLPGTLGAALTALAAAPDAGWLSGPVLFGSQAGDARLRRHPSALSVEGAVFGIPAINGRIFRRALLERIGPLRQDLGLAADREFMVRLAESGARGLAFGSPFYLYRVHEGSRTISGDPAGRRRVYKAEVELARSLTGAADTSPAFLRLLRASAAVAHLKLKMVGGASGEPFIPNAHFVGDLIRGILLARRWRGRLSGY